MESMYVKSFWDWKWLSSPTITVAFHTIPFKVGKLWYFPLALLCNAAATLQHSFQAVEFLVLLVGIKVTFAPESGYTTHKSNLTFERIVNWFCKLKWLSVAMPWNYLLSLCWFQNVWFRAAKCIYQCLLLLKVMNYQILVHTRR